MDSNKKFYGVNNETWGHKWGYSDSGFVVNKDRSVTFTGERYPVCGKRLPNFIPFVEEVLGIEFKAEPKIKEVSQKHVSIGEINKAFVDDLKKTFAPDRFCPFDSWFDFGSSLGK